MNGKTGFGYLDAKEQHGKEVGIALIEPQLDGAIRRLRKLPDGGDGGTGGRVEIPPIVDRGQGRPWCHRQKTTLQL